jgi:hypothetical protein
LFLFQPIALRTSLSMLFNIRSSIASADAVGMPARSDDQMCNLYSITTNQAANAALLRVINGTFGNLPPMPGVFYRLAWSCQGIASGGPRVPPRADSARIFKLKL